MLKKYIQSCLALFTGIVGYILGVNNRLLVFILFILIVPLILHNDNIKEFIGKFKKREYVTLDEINGKR